MRMPAGDFPTFAAQRQVSHTCEDCEEEERPQRTPTRIGGGAGAAPAIVHDVLRSPGRALDAGARAFFEPRFGRDFSGVRLHGDSQAIASARAVGAKAYTVGPDMVFGAAQSAADLPLLAHELAHVVQMQRQVGNRATALILARAPETWYRGEAPGVPRAKLGGSVHDLTDGLYFTDSAQAAQGYGDLRAGATGGGNTLGATFDRRILGKVLDLPANPQWARFLASKPPVSSMGSTWGEYMGRSTELYNNGFHEFLRQNKLQLTQYDAIIAEDLIRNPNAKQLVIVNEMIAERVDDMLARVDVPKAPKAPGPGPAPVSPRAQGAHGEVAPGTQGSKTVSGGGGGTLAPVSPRAQGAHGEVAPGTQGSKTVSGGGGGTLAPVSPRAQGAHGEVAPGTQGSKTVSGGGGGTLAPVSPRAQGAHGEVAPGTQGSKTVSGGGGTPPSGGGTVAELEKDLTNAVRTEEAVEGLGIGTAAAVTVGESVISSLIANLALQAALEIILFAILPGQNEDYVEPKLVQEAFEHAIPKILTQLALRGVGEHPSGEFAQLLERTKGGQSIYANALVSILPPVLRTGIPVAGQEVYEKKTEVTVLWVSLSTTSSATKEPLRLTIDRGEREGPLRVLSFRVYNPDAIATELLVKKPEVV